MNQMTMGRNGNRIPDACAMAPNIFSSDVGSDISELPRGGSVRERNGDIARGALESARPARGDRSGSRGERGAGAARVARGDPDRSVDQCVSTGIDEAPRRIFSTRSSN